MANEITYKGILVINGKQVEDTFNGLRRAAGQLERDLKKLPVGSDEFIKKSKDLEIVQARFNNVKKEIDSVKKTLKDTGDQVDGFKAVFTGFLAADFFKNITQQAFDLGRELKKRIDELNEVKGKLTQLDENLKGSKLNNAASTVKAISLTYNKSVEEITLAVKGLNAQTKDTSKSLDLIKKGFEAGADASGEMLTQLKEYPTMMNDARVSAEEMIAIMAHSEKMSVYDDKGIDAIKEGMLRVREGTKSAQDAMKALGIDTEDIYAKIKAGTLSYFDVIKMVSGKLKDVGADSRITGKAIADIFGGPGEDAGYEYLSTLGEIDTNLNTLIDKSSEYNILKAEELKANEKLNQVYSSLTSTGSALNSIYNYLRSSTAYFLSNVLGIRNAKLSEEYQNQAAKLDYMGARLNATNISESERVSIYKQLKAEYPKYFSNLDLEKTKHENIAKAIRSASNELRKKYQLQALNETLDEKGQDFKDYTKATAGIENLMQKANAEAIKKIPQLANIKLKSSDVADNTREYMNFLNNNKSLSGNDLALRRNLQTLFTAYNESVDNKNNAYHILNNEIRNRQKQITKFGLQDVKLDDPYGGSDKGGGTPLGSSKDANLAAGKPKKDNSADKLKNEIERQNKDAESAADKSADSLLKITQKLADEKIKIIDDELKKELALEENKRNDEKELIKAENEGLLKEIKDLEKKKEEAKSTAAKEAYQKAINSKRDIIAINNQLDQAQEDTHQKKLGAIEEKQRLKNFEKFTQSEERRINESRRLDEEEIIGISSLTEAKLKLKDNEYLKLTDLELQKIETLEGAKKALQEAANRKMLKMQMESLQLQKAQMLEDIKKLSGPAAEKLKADLAELESRITQIKSVMNMNTNEDEGRKAQEQKQAKEQTDILGFSAADWEKAWNDLDTTEGKIMAVGMAMKALSNAGQMFAQLQQNLNERELRSFTKVQDKKKKELLKQLNEGYINNEEYHKQMELLEVEMANKKAELDYKQAKADKTARMFAIVGDTAAAIATALKAGPIAGPILAGIVGAMGAIQLGIVASQPLPERQSFDTGGYTGSGFGSPDSSGYKPAGIVHENEWVAPKWMLYNPQTARIIDYLETIRQGKTSPYAEGGKTTDTKAPNTTTNPGIIQMDPQLVNVLSQISDFLEYLKINGVDAWVIANEANGKEMKKAIESYDKIRNGAKAK